MPTVRQFDRDRKEIPLRTPESMKYSLGNLARSGIDLATFGLGKELAETIAAALNAKGCGCGARQSCLNDLIPDVRKVSALEWPLLMVKALKCIAAKEDD